MYEIVGDQRALSFYYINPDSGAISLKKPLTEGTHVEDLVSSFSCNGGIDKIIPTDDSSRIFEN